MHLLELETVGECERGMKRHTQKVGHPAETGQNQRAEPSATVAANTILSL
jgi:hypothetical protein